MKSAADIVNTLLDVPAGLTVRQLRESPQYYPSEITYMRDAKFRPLTARNFNDCQVLEQDVTCTYVINASGNTGFVFANADLHPIKRTGAVPVMLVQLRESGINGYKQAYGLRIRQAYAAQGIATHWYMAYVSCFGGIVSDATHLEGGKRLWRSFVETAASRGLRITLHDQMTGERTPVDASTPDDMIWSRDAKNRHLLLVLEQGAK